MRSLWSVVVFTFCWITKLNWGKWGLQNLIKHQGYFNNACSIPKSHSSIYKKSWNGSCLGMHYSVVDTWGKRQSGLQTCFVSREKTWWGWSWPWGDSRVCITIWFKQLYTQTHTVGHPADDHFMHKITSEEIAVNVWMHYYITLCIHMWIQKWIHLCLPVVHLLCTCPQITTHGSNH